MNAYRIIRDTTPMNGVSASNAGNYGDYVGSYPSLEVARQALEEIGGRILRSTKAGGWVATRYFKPADPYSWGDYYDDGEE